MAHVGLRVGQLTALGDATEDTKRRISRRELDDDPDTLVVLEELTRARLVVVDRNGLDYAPPCP